MPKNILFIMCDQLRWDYLGCYRHPSLETPNIDALAARGVRFTRAYVQSPVCGPSRMSFYTGRYVSSHGSTMNGAPLNVNERNIGDHLRPLGVRPVLCGKTHMAADREGMERLGVDPQSTIGAAVAECGFDIVFRDDGVHTERNWRSSTYNNALSERGYGGDNPWHWWANSAEDAAGKPLSGWLMKDAEKPARIDEDASETAVTTQRALDFIAEAGDRPWCLHLSYIKPHWPYVAPAPYHALYSADDVIEPIRHDDERVDPHPLLRLYMTERKASQSFARDDVRRHVIPAYMGLIKQIDDHVGVVLADLEKRGLLNDTMIVFTSDHGDYLGDHWLGEKDFFHEPCVKIPLIVVDPSAAADGTRGTTSDALVEAIDLLPTFVEALGGTPADRLEGLSLMPHLHGSPPARWRDTVFSEYDYGAMGLRDATDRGSDDALIFMAMTERWKYIAPLGFRPLLFDLENDPSEFRDLGDDDDYSDIRLEMRERLLNWALRNHQRTTVSRRAVDRAVGEDENRGFPIGYWNETDFDDPANVPRPPEDDGS